MVATGNSGEESCQKESGADTCSNPAGSSSEDGAQARMRRMLFSQEREPLPDGPPELVAARSALHDAFDGLSAHTSKDEEKDKAKPSGATYGELRDEGVVKVFGWLNLTSDDVFCDLGSGIGRMVMQAAMETPVLRSIGIEFIASRHVTAGKALMRLSAQGHLSDGKVNLVQGDLAEWPGLTQPVDGLPRSAPATALTVGCNKIFMNALAFPGDLKKVVVERILSHAAEVKAISDELMPPMRIVSTARLHGDAALLEGLPLLVKVQEGKLQASWDLVTAYSYEVRF